MTEAAPPPPVSALFEAYRSALERCDARALAGQFAYPCHITGDAAQTSLAAQANRADHLRAIERFFDHYRTAGVAAVRIGEMAVSEITPRLLQARLAWQVHALGGRRLYDFTGVYTLAFVDGAWRITAIAHDEFPRLQACLAERRAKRV